MGDGAFIFHMATVPLGAQLLHINQKGGCTELQGVAELLFPGVAVDVCSWTRSGQDLFLCITDTQISNVIKKFLYESENYYHFNN